MSSPRSSTAGSCDRAFGRSPASAPRSSSWPGNLPYDVQRLAHETWDEVRAARPAPGHAGRSSPGAPPVARRAGDDVRGALAAPDARRNARALRAVVLEEGRELLSADVRTRHRLGGPSTMQAALAALLRDDVVSRDGDRYVVVDSLLREWVARRTF